MKKKTRVTFKRGTSSESYMVESLVNLSCLSVSPSKFVRVGDTITAQELDWVVQNSRAEITVRS